MNESLVKAVTEEEVENALFSIGTTRAPGPDGFTTLFYQHYWEHVGPSIIKEVQTFFETGFFPQECNQTNLCLIPKMKERQQ